MRRSGSASTAFFRSDHYLEMGGVTGLPGPTDAWITLAGMARETSTIRLGTLVTASTFRLPGVLAVSVAQVDAMSGGRVELGIGAGWYDAEHTAYGIPFPPTGERFDRLEEQLAVITGLWSTPDGARFDIEGHHYTLVDSPALPKPVQRPGPPIIIGGGGPTRTPRLAATYAAEFNRAFRSLEECDRLFRDGRAGVPVQRPGSGHPGPLRGPGGVLRHVAGRHRPPGGRHRSGGRRAAGERPVRHPRGGGGQAGAVRRPRRHPGLSADSSTCPTWTTWP